MGSRFRKWFVRTFWATHNDSPVIRQTLQELLGTLGAEQRGLNVGCGDTQLDERILNVDVHPTPTVDCVCDALHLPFAAEAFGLVFSQEAVEHVPDPFRAVQEMGRVMRNGGRLYLQVPFVIGYHPGPHDYWRFSREGIRVLVERAGLLCEKVVICVGPGTGAYRILVELLAGIGARMLPSSYTFWKALNAVLFYPLKWLDGWLSLGTQQDRIPGGYLAIGRKE